MLVMRSVVAELVDVAAWAGVVVAMASTRPKAMVAARVRMGWGGCLGCWRVGVGGFVGGGAGDGVDEGLDAGDEVGCC